MSESARASVFAIVVCAVMVLSTAAVVAQGAGAPQKVSTLTPASSGLASSPIGFEAGVAKACYAEDPCTSAAINVTADSDVFLAFSVSGGAGYPTSATIGGTPGVEISSGTSFAFPMGIYAFMNVAAGSPRFTVSDGEDYFAFVVAAFSGVGVSLADYGDNMTAGCQDTVSTSQSFSITPTNATTMMYGFVANDQPGPVNYSDSFAPGTSIAAMYSWTDVPYDVATSLVAGYYETSSATAAATAFTATTSTASSYCYEGFAMSPLTTPAPTPAPPTPTPTPAPTPIPTNYTVIPNYTPFYIVVVVLAGVFAAVGIVSLIGRERKPK
ncbi:MAG: hypothetical protein WB984_06055 [Thermoplasmata archaeon]